jgi:hypothetical protein
MYLFEMKYGNTINPMPLTSGIIAFCFLPLTKKPKPIEPKMTPQIKLDMLFILSDDLVFRHKTLLMGIPSLLVLFSFVLPIRTWLMVIEF